MESRKIQYLSESNVQFTCPSSGCWQSLEDWFANLSTMLQTICQWTPPRLPYQPKHGTKRTWIFQRSLVVTCCRFLLSLAEFLAFCNFVRHHFETRVQDPEERVMYDSVAWQQNTKTEWMWRQERDQQGTALFRPSRSLKVVCLLGFNGCRLLSCSLFAFGLFLVPCQ